MSGNFKQLVLKDWRQFHQIDIEFHSRLTVLTGANGAGKTTLLNILGRHFGWSVALIATSRQSKKGAFQYYSGMGESWGQSDDVDSGNQQQIIGSISYGDGEAAPISVSYRVDEAFQVNINNQERIDGVFLPSHRPVYSYQKVVSVPATLETREGLYELYLRNLLGMYTPQRPYDSPSFKLKSSLLSLALFGEGNSIVEPNPEALNTFHGFEQILSKVLPPRMGFRRLVVRMPEVILDCDSGEFSLDAASGGVAALIDVAWQLYVKALVSNDFVVVIDEPENHLHPEMQLAIMPGLINAFPNVQFIVATHNPFIVTAVEDSSIYVLNYEDDQVISKRIDDVDRSASANRVLMDVLGLPAPIPLWVQNRLDEVVFEFSDQDLSTQTLSRMRAKMNEVGLGRMFPEAVDRLVVD